MKKTNLTIYDIAKKAGVSPATVSRVLNHPDQVQQATREAVMSVMNQNQFAKRNYRTSDAQTSIPESNMATYLVLIPSADNPFYSDVISGIYAAASLHHAAVFTVYINLSESNLYDFLSLVKTMKFAGLIVLCGLEPAILRKLSELIPVIQCSEYNELVFEVSSVSIDDVVSQHRAANYLISTGHTQIAYMACPLHFRFSKRRIAGFERALSENGLTCPERWIIKLPQVNFQVAYDAAITLLKADTRPDSILCASDTYAAACLKAAHDLKINVPDALSVIGFDDIPLAQASLPALTTIRQPRFQLGYTAFETLNLEMEDISVVKQHIFLQSELIVRDSTSVLRK